MSIRIAKDGWWHILAGVAPLGLAAAGFGLSGRTGAVWFCGAAALAWAAAMAFFFRDPERKIPEDPAALVAGADGLIRSVEFIPNSPFLNTDAVRISIFLSPLDVHINRSPLAGTVTHLAYTPGRHLLTISNRSSEHNEHSDILIEGPTTRALVRQIVGPIVRRVVYWLKVHQPVAKGERIGLMRFGSRLDMYFPARDVEVCVKKGDRVRAGETIVARVKKEAAR